MDIQLNFSKPGLTNGTRRSLLVLPSCRRVAEMQTRDLFDKAKAAETERFFLEDNGKQGLKKTAQHCSMDFHVLYQSGFPRNKDTFPNAKHEALSKRLSSSCKLTPSPVTISLATSRFLTNLCKTEQKLMQFYVNN
jgi:hypothetical protein